MDDHLPSTTIARRALLRGGAAGLGSLALGSILARADDSSAARWRGLVQPPHHRPRARSVIHLCMAGGPSHLETLDHKPELARRDGEPMPESMTKGQPIAQLQGKELRCLAPQHPFARYGESGQEICTLFPRIGSIADRIAIVRSMRTKQINHDPAHTFMNTGAQISGRPSMGSWAVYGLGTGSDDLPGFVVMTSKGKGGQGQPIAARQWHSGFLPGRFQGVHFRSAGDPVLYLGSPPGTGAEMQGDIVAAVQALDRDRNNLLDDPEISARISQYEVAFRMQASVPELTALSSEPQSVLDLYGTRGADGSFAANCLLARRLVERGVRFVQLYHRAWDHHGGIQRNMKITANEVDQASAALVIDLEQRGLLEDTLVIWGGEFGRTPMAQGDGRDHHIKGFSMWLAGGGIRGGCSHGATDELGYNAVEDVVEIHDLHATIMHLLGIEHDRFTYRFQGRDFRLTDVSGHVVEQILA